MRPHAIQLALAFVSLAVMAGCHSRPGYTCRDARPLYDHDGQARSLALSTPPIYKSKLETSPYGNWYDGRNDIGPFVTSGYATIQREQSVTYTRDQQYIYNGRVYDRYKQTTYRRSTSESAR